jgi:hypothetical protein
MERSKRIAAVGGVLAVLLALVALYLFDFLFVSPPTFAATVSDGVAHLTLQTVPSYGHAPEPDWVSYLAQDSGGHWHHTTVYQVPAHTLVKVTLYQYDTATGLRNPFLGQVRGTTGGVAAVNGRSFPSINPNLVSHTFSIPDLGVSVPLIGISATAKNPCGAAPCPLSTAHTTMTFSFMSPGPGEYRWQCFVPCAAGFYLGFGGPMQSIGWMDGWIKVV